MPVLSPALTQVSEQELQKAIDRAVSRAMFDAPYASHLLADPTIVLEDRGCTPQQYLALRAIHAASVGDFARQAQRKFWPTYVATEQEKLAAAAI